MTINALVEKELEKVEEGEYKESVKKLLNAFGMVVIREIHRLNIPAFTVLEDDDFTKQGFVNAMLNLLIDNENDKYYCNKAWRGAGEHGEVPPNDRWLVVEKKKKLYIAKYDHGVFVSQEGKVYKGVDRWREFFVQHYE